MSNLILMFITNSVKDATWALEGGANRLFIDLETIGKEERQGGLDTVKSNHTLDDVAAMRMALPNAEILVRLNPLGNHSPKEIDAAIANGADLLMLPMFTTTEEVKTFIDLVRGRVRTSLLLETPQAFVRLPDYLRFADHIDEVHMGLNDLHLGMNLDFMFELLAGGLVDHAAKQLRDAGVRFGFGGVARVGFGDIPAEDIILEHVRLGSEVVILSRSFHQHVDRDENRGGPSSFAEEVAKLRAVEARAKSMTEDQLNEHSRALRRRIFAFTAGRRKVS